MIHEGKAILSGNLPKSVSKELPVFYNPAMQHNRDLTIAVITAWGKNIQAADILAASGVRSIRLLQECKNIDFIAANDVSKTAHHLMQKNFVQNKMPKKKYTLSNQDASQFLLQSKGFDYIDIDPFGSPNPFLDAAAKRLARGGILAVTATDTAALAGTIPKACMRKYWALPLKNASMHELGIRILVRKIQLVAAQYDKALVPVFSYAAQHYMRVFLMNTKGKKSVDTVLEQHKILSYCKKCGTHVVAPSPLCSCGQEYTHVGPVWTGRLWDAALVSRMQSSCPQCARFLLLLAQEAQVDSVGICDLNLFAKKFKKTLPKREEFIKHLQQKGFQAAPTHFLGSAIRTNAPVSFLEFAFGSHEK